MHWGVLQNNFGAQTPDNAVFESLANAPFPRCVLRRVDAMIVDYVGTEDFIRYARGLCTAPGI